VFEASSFTHICTERFNHPLRGLCVLGFPLSTGLPCLAVLSRDITRGYYQTPAGRAFQEAAEGGV